MRRWEILLSLISAVLIAGVIWKWWHDNLDGSAQIDPLAWFWLKLEERIGPAADSGSFALTETWMLATGATITGGTDTAIVSGNDTNILSGTNDLTGDIKLPGNITTGTLTAEQYTSLQASAIWFVPEENVLLQRCSLGSSYCQEFYSASKHIAYADALTGTMSFVPLFLPLNAGDDKEVYTLLSCMHTSITGSQRSEFVDALYKQEWELTQDRVTKTAQTLSLSLTESCTQQLSKYMLRFRLEQRAREEMFGTITQIPFHVFLNTATRNWVAIPWIYEDGAMYKAFDIVY